MNENIDASGKDPWLTIGNASQIIAIAIAVAYICGFIIVSAYFGSLGIKDYEAFRTQYIISGITFLVVLGLIYYVFGRKIFNFDKQVKIYDKQLIDIAASGKYWGKFAQRFLIFELLFLMAMTAIIASSILFDRALEIYAPFLFSGVVISVSKSHKPTKLLFVLVEISYLLFFLVFCYLADWNILLFLGFELLTIVYILLMIDASQNTDKTFTLASFLYLTVLMFVTLGGIFGHSLYGHIKSTIGGGKPEQVRLVIDESNTPMILQKKLNISKAISTKINLIDQTDNEIFLGFPLANGKQGYESLIRIDRKLIKAIISDDASVIKN